MPGLPAVTRLNRRVEFNGDATSRALRLATARCEVAACGSKAEEQRRTSLPIDRERKGHRRQTRKPSSLLPRNDANRSAPVAPINLPSERHGAHCCIATATGRGQSRRGTSSAPPGAGSTAGHSVQPTSPRRTSLCRSATRPLGGTLRPRAVFFVPASSASFVHR